MSNALRVLPLPQLRLDAADITTLRRCGALSRSGQLQFLTALVPLVLGRAIQRLRSGSSTSLP